MAIYKVEESKKVLRESNEKVSINVYEDVDQLARSYIQDLKNRFKIKARLINENELEFELKADKQTLVKFLKEHDFDVSEFFEDEKSQFEESLKPFKESKYDNLFMSMKDDDYNNFKRNVDKALSDGLIDAPEAKAFKRLFIENN